MGRLPRVVQERAFTLIKEIEIMGSRFFPRAVKRRWWLGWWWRQMKIGGYISGSNPYSDI